MRRLTAALVLFVILARPARLAAGDRLEQSQAPFCRPGESPVLCVPEPQPC